MTHVSFYFESNSKHRYVGVLDKSNIVSGPIVSQNSGSALAKVYYQVGGVGLNGEFKKALGSQLSRVNAELVEAYDREKVGTGIWDQDSVSKPVPVPLTSLLVPINSCKQKSSRVSAMVYSVGPQLDSDGSGLVGDLIGAYTNIYADAMRQIESTGESYSGFRITMLSSGIFRGGAPIAQFSQAAAGAILDAITTAVKRNTDLSKMAILINTDDYSVNRRTGDPQFPKERMGFLNAAAARNAKNLSWQGFTIEI